MNTKCKTCRTELHFEQFQQMNLFHEDANGRYYKTYCPRCKTYGTLRPEPLPKRNRKLRPTKYAHQSR